MYSSTGYQCVLTVSDGEVLYRHEGDTMKNIYLIGDSIRYGSKTSTGYEYFLRQKLSGKANIFSPNENCRFAQYTLRALYDWVDEVDSAKIDIVHWNNGLWDVLRMRGDEPLTPLPVYISMLERVFKTIRAMFSNAKIIFALSTPVIEKNAPKGWMRYNHEIEEYNLAAAQLMEKLGVKVNDLYAVAKDFDESYYADWVHFNDIGANILADEIMERLDLA